MILTRLYELAQRERLAEDPAFAPVKVKALVLLGQNGQFLNLVDVRGTQELPSRRKDVPLRTVRGRGRVVSAPIRPVVWDEQTVQWKPNDPAASGKERPAVFLVDTIGRVLPVMRLIDTESQAKYAAQRSTFWRFLTFAAQETRDDGLKIAAQFGERLNNPELQEILATAVEKQDLLISDMCALAWESDGGAVLVERGAVREFWRKLYLCSQALQETGQPRRVCQVTGELSAMPDSVKSRVSGLMSIDCRADAYLVSRLDSADSYGLEGAANAMISPRGLDTIVRAMDALIGNNLAGQSTSRRIGKLMLLFWTRTGVPCGMESAFDPAPDSVANLLASAGNGAESYAVGSTDDFYLLAITGNSARIVVRDYLEAPLAVFQANLARWFGELRIADATRDGMGQPKCEFPLWLLAGMTAMDGDHVAPDIVLRLTLAAVRGDPLPHSVLSACLGRLRAEGREGFKSARMALIKLSLIRMGFSVSESLKLDESSPAYICGRLLSVFEQIQYEALGDVNSNVVDKYFGTFSSAPGMVLGRLFANSQNHLRRIRTERPGAYVNLDKKLSQISALLTSAPSGQLSLADQGRFALGYYHQKARQFQEIADRRAAAASPSALP